MKILLIAPASGRWQRIGERKVADGRTFRFSMLSLLSVAAATPPGADIRIVDEQVEAIPWDDPVDLVGITCMTALAPRAYEIAAAFRQRGVPVVLGGMHATLCATEALQHADAVVAGDAEGAWAVVVEAVRSGRRPHGLYRAACPVDLRQLSRPPRHLLAPHRYGMAQAVQASRGCPHACDFCAVSAFHGGAQRRRPAADVAAEIAELPGKFVLFVDDNLTADRDYARDLFARLVPLRKWWVTQSTLAIANDPGLVRLAARAGCKGLFVGMETFNEANLEGVNKTCHRVEHYRAAVDLLHRHGIAVEAGIVFGFDGDRPETFASTLRRLDEIGIDLIQVSIFTPLPGTPRHAALADRIIDRDWSHYDFHHVVFRPRGLAAEELQAGHDWVTREFYSPARMLRRFARHLLRPGGWSSLPYLAVVNLAYHARIRQWGLRGWDPATSPRPTPAAQTVALPAPG